MCLAYEVSQSMGTPQTTRAMHEFSHDATVRVAKVGRKQPGASLQRTAQMNGTDA
jgi:hypothetical protein